MNGGKEIQVEILWNYKIYIKKKWEKNNNNDNEKQKPNEWCAGIETIVWRNSQLTPSKQSDEYQWRVFIIEDQIKTDTHNLAFDILPVCVLS